MMPATLYTSMALLVGAAAALPVNGRRAGVLDAAADGPPQTVVLEARARLLLNGTTYRVEEVPVVPRLPVLDKSNRAEHADWHAYVEAVYGKDVLAAGPLDLNTFNFFYWSAPLRPPALYLADFVHWSPEVPFGTPWIGGLASWTWGPEQLIRRIGYFVHRENTMASLAAYRKLERLEVMRLGPLPNRGQENESATEGLWFFGAIGSNVFVRQNQTTRLDLFYKRHDSTGNETATGELTPGGVPRKEIILRINSIDAPHEFWPRDLQFEHYDGSPCTTTARDTHLLTCAGMNIQVFSGFDPVPTRLCAKPQSNYWAPADTGQGDGTAACLAAGLAL